jgi:hypothetical protein
LKRLPCSLVEPTAVVRLARQMAEWFRDGARAGVAARTKSDLSANTYGRSIAQRGPFMTQQLTERITPLIKPFIHKKDQRREGRWGIMGRGNSLYRQNREYHLLIHWNWTCLERRRGTGAPHRIRVSGIV